MKNNKEKLERINRVRLPYDLRSSDPKKNYGIGGLEVWFILKGEKGAVQFSAIFPTYLPHVARELEAKGHYDSGRIVGIDVGYHAHRPQYEDQGQLDCNLFGGKCYYDGSSLRAQEWAEEIFSIRGKSPEDEIWSRLEQEYSDRFE